MSEFVARIEGMTRLSPHVRSVTLQPVERSFTFEPGQHVALVLDVDGEQQTRYYSIASGPRADNRFELCIAEAGSGSTAMVGMQPGDTVTVRGPAGNFRLRQPVDRELLFVASGTGISPLRAMIQSLYSPGPRHTTTLLLGARAEGDLLYRVEFEQLARETDTFRFLPTLSQPAAGWQGLRGRAQEHLTGLMGGRSLDIYVCGHKGLVEDMQALLVAPGHAACRLHSEST
jgi:CDP-4-dehydro-6-deoxyglucose reductase